MTPAYETMNYLGIIKEKTLFFKIGPIFKKTNRNIFVIHFF